MTLELPRLGLGCAPLGNLFTEVPETDWRGTVDAAWNAGVGKASWVWLLVYFVVITVGELYLSPTSLSLVTKIAPASLLSMMMGVWLATSFAGNFLAGYLGSFWSSMGKIEFFVMLAIISGTASAAIVLLSYPLRSVLRD